MPNANSFIADELAIKTKYLHKALDQAQYIISKLEQENLRLKNLLQTLDLMSDNHLVVATTNAINT